MNRFQKKLQELNNPFCKINNTVNQQAQQNPPNQYQKASESAQMQQNQPMEFQKASALMQNRIQPDSQILGNINEQSKSNIPIKNGQLSHNPFFNKKHANSHINVANDKMNQSNDKMEIENDMGTLDNENKIIPHRQQSIQNACNIFTDFNIDENQNSDEFNKTLNKYIKPKIQNKPAQLQLLKRNNESIQNNNNSIFGQEQKLNNVINNQNCNQMAQTSQMQKQQDGQDLRLDKFRMSVMKDDNFSHPKKRNYIIANVQQWTHDKFPWDSEMDRLKKQIFGIEVYRQNQKAIINASKSNKNVFVCMPTGGGKSLCYQLPALTENGLTIVIQPLISLIMDQVGQLIQYNVRAVSLTGSCGTRVEQQTYDSCLRDEDPVKLLYLTPEKIMKSSLFQTFLTELNKQKKFARLVIDEAHCVSQWGNDFRPDYLCLGRLKEQFPQVPVIALTATATESIRMDIVKSLRIDNCQYFQCSFNRSNLYYEVRPKETFDKMIACIAKFVQTTYKNKTGIVYCCTTKECEMVARALSEGYNLKASFYHGQMKADDRTLVQQSWSQDEIQIIVATIAFGMGINKPEVRFVIHTTFSKSIENYYQESGRAGRDGKYAHCIMFFKEADKSTLLFLVDANGTAKSKREGEQGIASMIKFCQETFICRREMQLAHFGERFERARCNKMCDNCNNIKVYEVIDCTQLVRRFLPKLADWEQASKYNNITKKQLASLLRGKPAKGKKEGLVNSELNGMLRDWPTDNVDLLLTEIMNSGLFQEHKMRIGGYFQVYLKQNKVKINAFIHNEAAKIVIKVVAQKKDEQIDDMIEDAEVVNVNAARVSKKSAKGFDKYNKKNLNQIEDEFNKAHVVPKKQVSLKTGNRIYVPLESRENDINFMNLDEYKFNQKSSENDQQKQQIIAISEFTTKQMQLYGKTKLFTSEFGYCCNSNYDSVLDYIKAHRKSEYNKFLEQNKKEISQNKQFEERVQTIPSIEGFFPLSGVEELARKLPTLENELTPENIKHLSQLQLTLAKTYLPLIQFILSSQNINKNDYYRTDQDPLYAQFLAQQQSNGAAQESEQYFDIGENMKSEDDNENDMYNQPIQDNLNNNNATSEQPPVVYTQEYLDQIDELLKSAGIANQSETNNNDPDELAEEMSKFFNELGNDDLQQNNINSFGSNQVHEQKKYQTNTFQSNNNQIPQQQNKKPAIKKKKTTDFL